MFINLILFIMKLQKLFSKSIIFSVLWWTQKKVPVYQKTDTLQYKKLKAFFPLTYFNQRFDHRFNMQFH